MATIKQGNWSFREPPLKDGDVVEGGTFLQARPGTVICADVKNLTIRGGNWTNVLMQPTWTVVSCNNAQKDFSPVKHADWVAAGHLKPDPKDPDDLAHRSAQPTWKDVTGDEYKALVDDGKATGMTAGGTLAIDNRSVDASGLTRQVARVRTYDYEDIDLDKDGKPLAVARVAL